ncbi:transposase [Mycolicibacterium agri]|uniref:Transposase n=1 Tax=Mycolicibacterium agri TaxID=36811 RepID=A0A2A7N8G9_MYCAG|nr:transposase [Mycolicibacterium agri]
MSSKPFRVRRVLHRGGRVSYWVFSATGELHRRSVEVLKQYKESSQQTYAYGLVDHLNWLDANRLTVASVRADHLRLYMNALTGQGAGVYGVAWRERPPLSNSAAANVATVVKAFYLTSNQADPSVVAWFSRDSSIPQHRRRAVTQNPLSPRRGSARPRFLPDEIVTALFEPGVLTSARDVMVVTWLVDSGIRVGGLCGLRFPDLHLVRDHPCGQRKDPHVHIVGRDDNPNRARAKAYHSWRTSPDGYVNDGVIRAVSEAMIGSFYAYLLDEYHPNQHLVDHEQVLIHTKGHSAGAALTTGGVRKMLRRASQRADLNSYITPHAFRHRAAANLYAASDFNADLVAQEFGWSRAEQVTELYGRSANRHTMKYLTEAWDSIPGRPTGRD